MHVVCVYVNIVYVHTVCVHLHMMTASAPEETHQHQLYAQDIIPLCVSHEGCVALCEHVCGLDNTLKLNSLTTVRVVSPAGVSGEYKLKLNLSY